MSAPIFVELSDVARFIRGVTFKPDDITPEGSPNSVWCMRTKNVQAELDLNDVWSIGDSLVKRSDQYLNEGDLLVSTANSWNLVGKVCWVPRLSARSTFGGFISVLRADPAKVDPRYLYHWFSSPKIQKTARSFSRQTTNISNLDLKRCLTLKIPVPSLAEQRRIAEVLDRADALRAKRREAIARLDELAQSLFLDMFGPTSQWPNAKLGDVVDEFRYGTSRRSGADGVPVLRIPNVVHGKIDTIDLKYTPLPKDELDRLRLHDGDLLFVRTNGNPEYVGRCAVFSREEVTAAWNRIDDFAFASYLIRARPSNSLNSTFTREFMLSSAGRRALRERAKTSAGQFNVNIDSLSSITIPQPPIELQEAFESRVKSATKFRHQYEQDLLRLDELFASLQQRAFRGEL